MLHVSDNFIMSRLQQSGGIGNSSGSLPLVALEETSRKFQANNSPNLVEKNRTQIAKCTSGTKRKRHNTRYPLPEKPRQKRAVIQDMVRPLKHWLLRHRHNPYPTKAEKIELAMGSNMTLVQVSNWFANARRRLKNVVQDPRCSWSKRMRMYNQFVQGNAELLSIASDDSIWDSNSESSGGTSDEIDVEKPCEPALGNDQDQSQLSQYKKNMLNRYLTDSCKVASEDPSHRAKEIHCRKRKRSTDNEDKDTKRSKEPSGQDSCRVTSVVQPKPVAPASQQFIDLNNSSSGTPVPYTPWPFPALFPWPGPFIPQVPQFHLPPSIHVPKSTFQLPPTMWSLDPRLVRTSLPHPSHPIPMSDIQPLPKKIHCNANNGV